MPNIFDIGVKLSLASNVGAGLRVLARDLMGIRGEIGKTQADLNRLRTVMIGGAAFTAGSIVLRGWWDLAKAGDRIIQQRQKMLSMGIDQLTVQQNYGAALRTAATIEGTTVAQNMALITLLRSTVGTSAGARSVLPGTARDIWVLKHLGQSEGDVAALFKAIDMLGWGINKATGQIDPAPFIKALNLITGAMNLMPHQILRGLGIYQFVRMAAPVAQLGGDPLAFLRNTFELMAQIGRTGGRGIAYMGIKLLGGQLTKAQEATLLRLGLVAPSGIGGTKEHPFLKTGAVKGYQELLQKGLLAWFRDVLFPAAGIEPGETTSANLSKLLNAMAGFPVTSQRMAGTLVTIIPMIDRFNEELNKELPHLDETFDKLQSSVLAQLGDLGAALDSFFEVLGVPAAQAAIPFLQSLTGGVQDLTLVLGEDPWLAEIVDDLAAAFGSFLGVNGGIMILRGALGMLKLAIPDLATAFGPFVAGGTAAVALRLLTSPGGLIGLAVGISLLGKSFKDIPQWIVNAMQGALAGAALGKKLAGPKGAVIGAVSGAAGGVVWNLDPFGLGDIYWSPLRPLTLTHVPMIPARRLGAAGAGLPLPPPPPPLPLPPTPPAVHVTLHSPISLPIPPMSESDIESMFRRAIYSHNEALLQELARAIVRQQQSELIPVVEDAIRQMQAHQRRRTMQDPAKAVGFIW